jgi:hypothetical protein
LLVIGYRFLVGNAHPTFNLCLLNFKPKLF